MLVSPIQIVGVESAGAQRESEDLDQQAARIGDSCRPASSEQAPVPHVLFRPEEIHLVSSQRELAAPFRERHIGVRDHAWRRDGE